MAAACASGAHDLNGRCAPVLVSHHFRSGLSPSGSEKPRLGPRRFGVGGGAVMHHLSPPPLPLPRIAPKARGMVSIATWNINSVRLREGLVARLMTQEGPDVLCLQECKSPVDKIPVETFRGLGYTHMVARGQKGYNGVAILSKLPLEDAGSMDFATLGHARHIAARLPNGVVVHNCYVPAGGDIPDREQNDKFGQKLDFLTEMRDHFHAERPERSILVGDLNIAFVTDALDQGLQGGLVAHGRFEQMHQFHPKMEHVHGLRCDQAQVQRQLQPAAGKDEIGQGAQSAVASLCRFGHG